MSDAPLFDVGHNSETPREQALRELAAALAGYEDRRLGLIGSISSFKTIRDRFDVRKATDVLGIAKGVAEIVEADARAISQPHAEAARAVAARFAEWWDEVDTAARALRKMADDFVVAEDNRAREAQAEQDAVEAKLRAERASAVSAPAPPPPPAAPEPKPKRYAARGDMGSTIAAVDQDVIEIEDWRQLPDFVFQSQPVIDAIKGTVKALVTKGVPISGIKVTKATTTRMRR